MATPFNIDHIAYLLRTHPNRPFVDSVLWSLRNGFWPCDESDWEDELAEEVENRPMDDADLEAVRAYRDHEIGLQRWSTPVPELVPFTKVSPMFVVWQHEKGLEEVGLNFKTLEQKVKIAHAVHADAVCAVVGAVYAHCGREAVKTFIRDHVLSRQLDFESLFRFKLPTKELASLCARENFEPPVARMLSETGRLSRTPVFVVGIFSGTDKLGEGSAGNPDLARTKEAVNALKAWYLYSPGPHVRVPSDMLVEGAKAWDPVYIDIGEVL